MEWAGLAPVHCRSMYDSARVTRHGLGPPAVARTVDGKGSPFQFLAPMTTSASYRAPFAPGGPAGIDATICERLLAVALAKGGDYADLFFEYRAGGGFVFDEGILKSASRGVSVGLGVRVQRGDATGYAYVEDLSWEAMKRAAETASQIATAGGGAPPIKLRDVVAPLRYELPAPTIDTPGE